MHRLFVHGTLAPGRPDQVALPSGEVVDTWSYVDRAVTD